MYIALNGTLTAGANLSWEEFARLAASAGFGGVDVNLGGATETGPAETRKLLAELKLKPSVVGLPVNFREDDGKFREDLKKLPAAARLAAAIGCPRFGTWLLPAYDLPQPEMTRIYRERLGACGEVLRGQGIRLALEFVSPWHLRTSKAYLWKYRMDEMLEFAVECGPNVGVLLDSWHWHHAQGTVQNILDAGREKIVHVQTADAPDLPPEKIQDFERLMPGEGTIDLDGFFGALKKIGYADGVSPEVFGRGLREMSAEDGAALGLDWTRRTMRHAGIEI